MRAKPNKPDIHIRLEKWMMDQIKELADLTGWNYTRVIESALEPGLNWLRKERKKKMHPEPVQEAPSPQLQQYTNAEIEETIELTRALFHDED